MRQGLKPTDLQDVAIAVETLREYGNPNRTLNNGLEVKKVFRDVADAMEVLLRFLDLHERNGGFRP